MIRGRNPPNHRHDGNSPLPLGMDWSPPPKKWIGRDTTWPHDPRTGWSYCVTIPSWVALPKSRSSASDPVVFYRVQVGIQSPDGITTARGILRRFNDFLKLFSDLKKAFPKKTLPSAPPKGLLRMKSRALLEERRCSLEEWMSKLLSDIDISRSMAVASFLELEAAARSSFKEGQQQPSEAISSTNSTDSSQQIHPSSSALVGSLSVTSDYGSDTAYETSELGSPSLGRDDGSESGLEDLTLGEGFTNPMENLAKYSMANIEEGLLMGESILDQLESFKKDKINTRHVTDNGSSAPDRVPLTGDEDGSVRGAERGKTINHIRKLSNESMGSDLSSYRDSELSKLWAPNLLNEVSPDLNCGSEVSRAIGIPGHPELEHHGGGQIILPKNQQPKLDRILETLQRRLGTAKTDMEDLITRLNKEIAVKEYLTTKVKDLEVELETTKEKSKENLQQALSLEKERITKMQWDMEELRRKSYALELKLKSNEDSRLPTESRLSTFPDKDELSRELEATKHHLDILSKQHEELEVKSKSDIKILIKEVKSLRKSQSETKKKLDESLQAKLQVEQQLQQEMERSEQASAARVKLLHDCQSLLIKLQHCNVKFDVDNSPTISDVLDLLAESDIQTEKLLTETQHFKPEAIIPSNKDEDDTELVDHELKLVLGEIFVNSAKLRKQMNLSIRSVFQTDSSTSEEDGKQVLSRDTLLKQVLETLN